MSISRWLSSLVLGLLLSGPAVAAPGGAWMPAPEQPAAVTALPATPPEWVEVDGTWARVHGPAGREDLLLRVANHVSRALPRLAGELGVPVGDTVHVYVVDSDAAFRSLQPGAPPTWADATAWPGLGAVFLRAPELRPGTDSPLEQVIDHELVHVLLGRAFAPAQPPSWLQEGIARTWAHEAGPEDGALIASGQAGPPMTLGELSHGFPRDPLRARLAYAQSADFIAWLGYEYGDRAVPTLIRALAAEQDLDAAVFAATGAPLPQVEQAWLDRLHDGPPAWLGWLSGEAVMVAGAVSLIGAGVLRRRQFHQRMEERAREEAMVDAMVGFRGQQASWG